MREALIGLIVCAFMISAFAMTNVVSAKENTAWQAGNSDTVQVRNTLTPGYTVNQHINDHTLPPHSVYQIHDKTKTDKYIENFNSNNPNAPVPPQ